MSNLYIITVATQSKYYFPYLIESVKKNNNKLKVLGFNQEWKGFNWKFNLMKTELNSYKLDDIVCFVDGYDVMCVRDLNLLINEFIKIKQRENCKIIAGFDNVPNKINKIITNLYFTNNINEIVINSGTYIGYVKDILDILNTLDQDASADDQILLNKYNKNHPGDIFIDINNELFLTVGNALSDIKKYTIIENNTVYGLNKMKPFFIHAAGCGFLDNIIIDLGYKYDHSNKINDQVRNDYLIKMFNLMKNIIIKNFNKYKYKILFIIIFTLGIWEVRSQLNQALL